MRETFDRRVIAASVLDFVRACQSRVPCHLGGGAALSGAYLVLNMANWLTAAAVLAAGEQQTFDVWAWEESSCLAYLGATGEG